MNRKKKQKNTPKRTHRKGVAQIVYLPAEQALELDKIAKNRHITKATILRLAVDRFLLDMRNGQLELPLGVSSIARNVDREHSNV